MKYSYLPDHCGQGVITRVSTYLAVQIRRTTSVAKFKAENLPATAAFSLKHQHGLLDGALLPQSEALQQEWQAFELGWHWYQNALRSAGFVIERQ
jgi:hypothetical protein